MATLAVQNAVKKGDKSKKGNGYNSSVQIIDLQGNVVPPDNRRPPAKKRNQKEWDELMAATRTFCREEGLPTTISTNPLLFLMEEMGEMTTSFPPPALTISNAIDARCMKVLINVIRCQAFHTYQQTFQEPSKGIHSVSVWNSPLGDDGVKSVVSLLLHFPLITKLELMDCAISSLACAHLAPAIAQRAYTNLKILRIHHNPIGNEGLINLVEAMYYNSHLQELSLEYCGIQGEVGGKWIEKLLLIPDSAITTLHIRGNELAEFGLHAVARALVSTTRTEKVKPSSPSKAVTRAPTTAAPTRATTSSVKPALMSPSKSASNHTNAAAVAPISSEPSDPLTVTVHSPLRVFSYNQNRFSTLENQSVLMDFLLAITKYSQVTAVDLSGNTINKEGMQRIIFAMQECKHVQHFNVNSFVNLEENQVLKELLSKNIPPRVAKKKKKGKKKS